MFDNSTKGRRVVFYVNILRDGAGMINREIGFSRQLYLKGYDVSIISHFKPTRLSPDVGIKMKTVWNTRYLNILYNNILLFPITFIKLFIILVQLRPEILFVDLYQEAWWGLVFKAIFRYKVIFTYHGVADSKFYSGKKREELIRERQASHKILKKVDEVIIVSNYMRKELADIGVESATIYNGIENVVDCIHHGNAGEKPVAVFVGRYTEYKGALNIIKSFKQLHSMLPTAALKMYGYFESQSYLTEINDYISSNKLEEVVELNDVIDSRQFFEIVSVASVFVNGSTDETFGMPLLEAHALGVPCVAFASGGIPEVVADRITGLLAAEGDLNMFAEHIYRIMSDNEYRIQLSNNALTHAKEYLYSALVEQVVEVIERQLS